MKKSISLFVLLAMSLAAFADYYVAGNGSAGNPWCDGKSWNPSGSKMTASGTMNTITFQNVPAGNYQFKITTGTWTTNYGYTSVDEACCNLEVFQGSDNNVQFTTTVQHNLTITFNATTRKICLTGDGEEPTVDPSTIGAVGVPAECEDVMLQGFYWNSCSKSTYGGKTTKWLDLMQDTTELTRDFDLIWFPPATGGSGVGYYANSYSFKAASAWGKKSDLQALIAALRRGGTKALADIVINHRKSNTGWAKGFSEEDFGGYGKFQLTSEHICAGDEAFTSSSSDSKNLPHGAADTGNNDDGCRDLDHTSTYVQNMCKAYTKYMLDSIGFAGFRYDMVIGYGGNYLSEYNLHSQPYLSVGEYWSDLGSTVGYLKTARYNTMVFDFPQKYALKTAINNNSFAGLKNTGNSLRGKGLSKYAVTFVDNHDTHDRDNTDYLVKDITTVDGGKKVIKANAFILMMPGVPCVFYPHWVTYKAPISHMIRIRKAAGIHSESIVTDEVGESKNYSATIQGHNGSVVLRMGANRDMTTPVGYTLVYQGNDLEIYLSTACVGDIELMRLMVAIDQVEEIAPAKKRLEDGKLVIERNGVRYDASGARR